ncbi:MULTISPECIES: hypothetical protein [unclassified Rhizobium]|uniref:hypothetical protein n=1 Tax=Hyphomicrobiales TaxID=356 RepID=UPI0006464021|nr:hypothetical protein [Rhizobium sp. WW_1]
MSEQVGAAARQADAAHEQVLFLERQMQAMQLQNEIARHSAGANYQFALFDKRVAIYGLLDAIGFKIISDGTVTTVTHRDVIRTVQAAKWIFDEAVREWLSEIANRSFEGLRAQGRVDRLNENMLARA